MKLNLTRNHLINGTLLVAGALLIVYNHFAKSGWQATPIDLAEFAPIAAMAGQWFTSIQAGHSESTRWISPAQISLIYEIAHERGLTPNSLHDFIKSQNIDALTGMTRQQGSRLIQSLKKLPEPGQARKEIAHES